MVERTISQLLANDVNNDLAVRFTIDDVKSMCQSMSKRKAAGWDRISAEHLIYGGDNLFRILTLIYNSISRSHVVPSHFKKGIIVPIPKGKDRNMLSKDNYRGISLLSVVSKVYEKLLLKWMDINSAVKINELQGACLIGASSLNTAMILRESVAGLRKHGNSVYVCLLDARKAFDTVWYKGLFYKLAKMGCNKNIWSIMWNFYQGFKCTVQIAGDQSEWFSAGQGVHQGGPFSMKLYVIFNSDLLDQLSSSKFGARLSGTAKNIHVCCPAYADDISIVALHKPNLQAMLDIAHKHSSMWRYEFNPQKSHVLIFGVDNSPATHVYIGDQRLKVTKSDKHLGVPLASDAGLLSDSIHGYISKGRRSFYAALSLGNRYQPVPPLSLAKLYWSIAIPQLTYGLELLNLSARDQHALEHVHMSIAKVIQGLPEQTAGPAVLALLQWWPMYAVLAYKRLTLLWRILLMSSTVICKEVVISSILNMDTARLGNSVSGPVWEIMKSATEYGLQEDVIEAVVHGSYCSIEVWKRTVKTRIRSVEKNRWLAQSMMYTKLVLFRQCISDHVWPWWVFLTHHPEYTQYCRTMARLMVGEHGLASNIGRRQDKICTYRTRLCQMCNMYVVEDVAHMLFTCKISKSGIEEFWKSIRLVAPQKLVLEMEKLPPGELTIFLFSGFKSPFIHEWEDVYRIICRYVHYTYNARINVGREVI
jgi:hypothetical protein